MTADLLSNIALGLSVALTFDNLFYCALGVTVGTFIGVLPGIGTLATMSMLFPITFYLDPTAALIMLAGIWYGSTYGGNTAAILLNLPGTPANAVACLDGYPMAKQGRGAIALFMTTVASFFGASVGILLMMFFSLPLVSVALSFSPAEYLSLMVMGLIAASVISSGSAVKGIAMVALGILIGLAGTDLYTGAPRFTFNVFELWDGVSLIALAMGIFGIAEVVASVRAAQADEVDKRFTFRAMVPTREDWRRSWMPMVRGSGIGSLFGVMPGVGSGVAAFISYAVEKRVSQDPSRFGKGAIEGIMAPETANNAADQTSFIPTLALGIPGSASMALILGVLTIHGITPGPVLITQRPEMFWGLVMSFWIGNILLVILNIPLIGIWVRLVSVPGQILYPAVVAFICIGVYTINNSTFDVLMVLVFGAFGYGMRTLDFPLAPLLLGFVLGPMLEDNFRRAMIISDGNFAVFVTRPISASFLLASLAIVLWGIWSASRARLAVRAP